MTNDSSSKSNTQDIEHEIQELEQRLRDAKIKLQLQARNGNTSIPENPPSLQSNATLLTNSSPPPHHFLLLLSDSALPLGSFAFSSGLESYLAHLKSSSPPPKNPASSSSLFPDFLTFSLDSYASTTLPFVLAAHRDPLSLSMLDDALDAAIMCTVGRRASVAQGRALLSIWDRSFSSAIAPDEGSSEAVGTLKAFSQLLKTTSSVTTPGELPAVSAHLAPLFGAISSILGMGLKQTAYVFMLSHVKALLSAAVRAGMFGPYHAQKVLASGDVQRGIGEVVEREWDTRFEDAGQSVPVMDLWIGRHEMLYSRIFNS